MTCNNRSVLTSLFVAVALGIAAPAGADEISLDRLAWMAGTWAGESGGLEMIEHWTDPKGGMMLGLHRDLKAGRAMSFEFFRIEATPKGIVYMASPRGRPATPFPMAEMGDKRVVFENREHDFPQRIIYRLTPDGSLNARTEGVVGGRQESEEWTWKRAR
jgi:hypothetical protein